MLCNNVTVPPLDPSARDEEEPDCDEEAQVWAAAMEHAAEVEDEETPDEYDWQISRLVSAATYTCHGRCILLSLIFYFKRHVTVGYFT